MGLLPSLEGRTYLVIKLALIRVKLLSRFLTRQSYCVIETLSQDHGELRDCDRSAAHHSVFHHVQRTTFT